MIGHNASRKPLVIPPGEGRVYPMKRMRAVFKADRDETANRYSVSEWWLDPGAALPNPHAHDEDHLFYVIEGMLSVLVDGAWREAPSGTHIVIPGGTPHAFENRGCERTGFISFNAPGGFEARMPAIAAALSEEA